MSHLDIAQHSVWRQMELIAHLVNIAKGTTDPGVDCFNQKFWFGKFG